MDYLKRIKEDKAKSKSHLEVAQKIFLCSPTYAFCDNEEEQYKIFKGISNFLKIPISSIQVAGSAKTGISAFKNSKFTPGTSDLDLAIINPNLFLFYVEASIKKTKGYSDRTAFPIRDGLSTHDFFRSRVSQGILRPDLMPDCDEKIEIVRFLRKLSSRHYTSFSSINVCIYLSELSFTSKQRKTITAYLGK
jgi:hypothetical protein